jgi:effector-binding domain-containing protein
MEYEVRLEHLSSRPLAVVRRRGTSRELARIVPEACGAVWNVIRTQKITGAGRHVALYLDAEINMEVGVELETPFAGSGEAIGSVTPAGAVATTVHFGPYSHLFEAHEAIRLWCEKGALTLAGPSWEIYGHWSDDWNEDPSLIRTDVFYLLKPTGVRLDNSSLIAQPSR